MRIKNFNEITKIDANIAGGKGASLGEMTRAGIVVPSGFVILANTFREFIRANNLEDTIINTLKRVSPDDNAAVNKASVEIRQLIKNAFIPEEIEKEILTFFASLDAEFVAVRSSATAEDSSDASWAGELETYLNTTKKDLLEAVKKCWSSLFTPRAIFYRFEKKMHEDEVAVAVVVQKMVESEIAGICFTVHPVTKDTNSIVIEAGWGLGETVVGGQITPDTYIVDKTTFEAVDIYPSEQDIMLIRGEHGSEEVKVPSDIYHKQKLSKSQIADLAKVCADIENHYGFPCDIEWAFVDSTFYIVQSRPITTL